MFVSELCDVPLIQKYLKQFSALNCKVCFNWNGPSFQKKKINNYGCCLNHMTCQAFIWAQIVKYYQFRLEICSAVEFWRLFTGLILNTNESAKEQMYILLQLTSRTAFFRHRLIWIQTIISHNSQVSLLSPQIRGDNTFSQSNLPCFNTYIPTQKCRPRVSRPLHGRDSNGNLTSPSPGEARTPCWLDLPALPTSPS
jgi:hypothetical protein